MRARPEQPDSAGTTTPGKPLSSPTTHPPSPSLRRTGMVADEKFLNRRERRKRRRNSVPSVFSCSNPFVLSSVGERRNCIVIDQVQSTQFNPANSDHFRVIPTNSDVGKMFTQSREDFAADGADGANAECSPRKTWQGMQNEEFLSVKSDFGELSRVVKSAVQFPLVAALPRWAFLVRQGFSDGGCAFLRQFNRNAFP